MKKKEVPKVISNYYRRLAKKSVESRHKRLLEQAKSYPQGGDKKSLQRTSDSV